jgi:hypothetical protein
MLHSVFGVCFFKFEAGQKDTVDNTKGFSTSPSYTVFVFNLSHLYPRLSSPPTPRIQDVPVRSFSTQNNSKQA